MKKILVIAGILCIANAYGQQSKSNGTPSKSLTVEEANRLNGTAEPTINGKPYSQYKAEQQALKSQQPVKLQVPEQFKTQEVKAWNGTGTQAKTTTPVFNPAQTPGSEVNPSKPIMAPDKADRSPEEIERNKQRLIAEEKTIKASETEKNTVASKEAKTPATVQPVIAVKDGPESTEAKTSPVVATQGEKPKTN